MWNSKPKKRGHSCGKHHRGNPKYGHGSCYSFRMRDSVVERIAGKKIVRQWLGLLRTMEADDVEL